MKNYAIKVLSVFISFLMVFYLLPASVYASFATNTDTETQSSATPSIEANSKEIVEVLDYREESAKHFRLEDGSYVAVLYDLPVHYLNAEGVWTDIDNTLFEAGSEYTTTNNKIKFAKKITGNEAIVTFHDGNKKITLSLDGAKKKTIAQIINTDTSFKDNATKLEKMMTLENLSSKILYEDILDGVDLEYIIESLNIKENIIVKQQRDSYSFTFTLSFNNLDAELLDDGSVNVFNSETKASVYSIPAPIVYDSNKIYADKAVSGFLLEKAGAHSYTLTVYVNEAWMNSENRAYPVIIDPTISVAESSVTDLYIDSTNANTNYNSSDTLKIGLTSSALWKTNSLPTLPNGAYITKATLSLKHISSDDSENNYIISGYRYASWDSSSTWNTLGNLSKSNEMTDFCHINTETEDLDFDGWYSWDVTACARMWYNGSQVNNGIQLYIDSASASVEDSIFYSQESNLSNRPKFVISYRNMTGTESYYSYASQSAGRAGAGHVNLLTGNLTFINTLTATTDSLLPYAFSLVYNSEFASRYITAENAEVPFTAPNAGYGFKINACETIVKKLLPQENGETKEYYVWCDSDGTEHYFSNVDGSTTMFSDEDGLNLSLEIKDTEYVMTDLNKTKKIFKIKTVDGYMNEGGILKTIIDKYGNEVNFEFNSFGRLYEISLYPSGSLYRIIYIKMKYNSSGMLQRLVNYASGEVYHFNYSTTYNATDITAYNGGYLRKIYRSYFYDDFSKEDLESCFYGNTPDSMSTQLVVSYSYDENGRIVFAVDERAYEKIGYSYDSQGKISEITEYVGENTKGQKISFIYNDTFTKLRSSGNDDIHGNSDDLYTTYCFDSEGRTINAYVTDIDGKIVYNSAANAYENEIEKAKNSIKTSISQGEPLNSWILNGGFELASSQSNQIAEGWHATSNVTRTSFVNSNAITESHLTCNLTSNSTYKIYQYVYLPQGEYTLSVDLISGYTKNIDITLKAESVSRSGNNYTYSLPISNLEETKTISTGIISLGDPSISFYGGVAEKFKITIEITTSTISDSSAFVIIDNVVLSNGIGSGSYNLVQYGNFGELIFTQNSSGGYTYTNPASSYWTDQDGNPIDFQDYNFLVMQGSIDKEVYAKQTIYESKAYSTDVSVKNRIFSISGMGRAYTANRNEKGVFALRAEVYYYGVEEPTTHTFSFEKNCNDWQFVSGNIETSGYVEKIILYCDVSHLNGVTGLFDHISVVECTEGSSINCIKTKYYENGLVWTQSDAYNTTIYEYDENCNTIRVANNKGHIVEYTYNSKNALVSEKVSTFTYGKTTYYPYEEYGLLASTQITRKEKSTTTYEYNEYGLITKIQTTDPQGTKIITQYAYNVGEIESLENPIYIFGSLKYETDSLGNKTYYFYDERRGVLLASGDPNTHNGVCYEYNNEGLVIAVYPAVITSTSYAKETGTESVSYSYLPNGSINGITTDSTGYTFETDVYGNNTSVGIGSSTLAEYEYNSNNGKLHTLEYGNGFKLRYVYDDIDNISEIWYTENGTSEYKALEYKYTAQGQLHQITNYILETAVLYKYDTSGRIESYSEYDLNDMETKLATSFIYDSNSRIRILSNEWIYSVGTSEYQSAAASMYTYGASGELTEYEFDFDKYTETVEYSYDDFGRLTSESYGFISNGTIKPFTNIVTYTYKSVGDSTSGLVETYSSQINSDTSAKVYTYSYDSNGNITKITDSTGVVAEYMYDNLGQLIRENNRLLNKTYIWAYDNAGNILSKKTYAYTTGAVGSVQSTNTYTYGDSSWGDLLTAYNGQTITYDSIGNPLTYYNGKEYSFTWKEGRLLSEVTTDGADMSFEYNGDGIRTSKTVAGAKTTYIVDGSLIISEIKGNDVIVYMYDANGMPVGMQYRNSSMPEGTYYSFFFERNLQGDIVAVYNENGTKLVSYTYDAWGNFTLTEHNTQGTNSYALLNPFRYRSYYYDVETELYYVSSRYYDPEIGRFINADTTDILTATPMGLTDKNLFAYCDNNPVVRVDHGGQFWDTVFDVISLGASIVEVCVNPTDPWAWAGLAGDAIDLIPFVTGVGEVTRAVKTIDKVADTVQIAKAVDFTDDAADIVKTLDRSSGFTKSTASAGRKIHAGYKATDNFSSIGKEYRRINGIRPDYIDFNTRTIYELKPMNPRGVRSGIRQLQKYNKALGGGFNLRLELY